MNKPTKKEMTKREKKKKKKKKERKRDVYSMTSTLQLRGQKELGWLSKSPGFFL